MTRPRALVTLLERKALEGAWDAQQGEINEAIFKAMAFDHDKTRALIRMPEVRLYVEKKLAEYPMGIKSIRSAFSNRLRDLRAELTALGKDAASQDQVMLEKGQEIAACIAAQEEKLRAYKEDFNAKLKESLERTLRNKMVYSARGWRDEIAPEFLMDRAGYDVEMEGRGARPPCRAPRPPSHAEAVARAETVTDQPSRGH